MGGCGSGWVEIELRSNGNEKRFQKVRVPSNEGNFWNSSGVIVNDFKGHMIEKRLMLRRV